MGRGMCVCASWKFAVPVLNVDPLNFFNFFIFKIQIPKIAPIFKLISVVTWKLCGYVNITPSVKNWELKKKITSHGSSFTQLFFEGKLAGEILTRYTVNK